MAVGLGAVVATDVLWLLKGPLEGPTVLYLPPEHGLTAGGVMGTPALPPGGVVLALSILAS